jgi:hypothetical protein
MVESGGGNAAPMQGEIEIDLWFCAFTRTLENKCPMKRGERRGD